MSQLHRFHKAQDDGASGFATAIEELRRGRKMSHWIWYVFPQLRGLGASAMAVRYGLNGPEEGVAYLGDRVLADRLLDAVSAVKSHVAPPAGAPARLDVVMGSRIDAQKLVSSLTLFVHLARRLHTTDRPDLALLADDAAIVLAAAAAQGYPACAFTERALSLRA
jgi:uncharacterized protein (DUF1810 family)